MTKQEIDKFWEEHNTKWQARQAMFLDWVQLKALLEYRLKALLGRDIKPFPFRDSDYWDVQTEEYSEEELEILFAAAEADYEDRENHGKNYLGIFKGPHHIFAIMIISPEFPFELDKSVVTEQGVYFLGVSKEYIKEYKKRS